MVVIFWQSTLTPLEEETYSFESEDEDDCSDAVGTGNLGTKMTIEREIPQFLPMMGRKIRVYYRGITKLCINCYQAGHIKKNCRNQTVGWIDYVQNFQENNNFSDKLYGNWIKILKLNKTRKEKAEQREKHLEAVRAEKDNENQNQEKASVEEMDMEENQSSRIQEKAQGSEVTDSKSSKEKTKKINQQGQKKTMSETFCKSERNKNDFDRNPKPITSTKRNCFVLGRKKDDNI